MIIGFIGFGNHANRLIDIIESHNKETQYKLYNHRNNYEKKIDRLTNVYSLEDLLDCDAIFIVSPNEAHFKYLEKLIPKYCGYIFCEKPPVTEKKDLEYLYAVDNQIKKRIYFNFNYRWSQFFDGLKNDSKEFNLGNLINATIINGHGLALKETYQNNWRSCKLKHKGGIFETFSIHFLDMFIYLFGMPVEFHHIKNNRSPYGDSIDNSCFICKFKNQATLNITTSYTCAMVENIILNYENGIVCLDDKKIVCGPRECFNEKGFFTKPPIIFRKNLQNNDELIYSESLTKSVTYFLDIVKNKADCEIEAYNASLYTNEIVLS